MAHQFLHISDNRLYEVFLQALPQKVAEEEPVIFGAIEEEKNEVSGVLAVSSYDDEWEILYIEVFAPYQRQGIGRSLVELAVSYARGVMASRINVSYVHLASEKEDGLWNFFDALGFALEMESEILSCRPCDFSSRVTDRKKTDTSGVIPLDKLSKNKWYALLDTIEAKGMSHTLETDHTNDSQGGMVYLLPGEISEYDGEISVAFLDDNMEPCGCMLFLPYAKGYLLSYLFSALDSKKTPQMLLSMIIYAYRILEEKKQRSATIYADIQNPTVKKLFEAITDNKYELYSKAYDLTRYL